MPHLSAMEAIKVSLIVLAVLGTARLFAMSHPDSAISQAYLLLY